MPRRAPVEPLMGSGRCCYSAFLCELVSACTASTPGGRRHTPTRNSRARTVQRSSDRSVVRRVERRGKESLANARRGGCCHHGDGHAHYLAAGSCRSALRRRSGSGQYCRGVSADSCRSRGFDDVPGRGQVVRGDDRLSASRRTWRYDGRTDVLDTRSRPRGS